ncbi:hypothetical protein N8987_00490 [Crocinitomix sp.]|nr:hypothetical protein [Crocinitomix sp.]
MIKWLFIIVISCNTAHAADIYRIRELFEVASTQESKNNELIELTKKYKLSQNPLYYAYHAAGIMSLANHTIWPFEKLNYFNKGKDMLEAAIKQDNSNIEIRFIRYSIQKNAPSLLGYYENMKTDRAYILKNINKSDWPESYKNKVKNNLSK